MKKILGLIIGLGGVLLYFGQACSSNQSAPSTNANVTSQTSGVLTAGSQTMTDGSQVVVSVTGGSPPYTYSIISGSGLLNSNIFTAPSTDGTTYVTVTDSVGASAIATLVYASTTTTVTAAITSEILSSSFEALAAYVPGCVQASPMGGDCAAGIHRYCVANGYATGFGPLEYSGDLIYFACAASDVASVVATDFASLHNYNVGCTISNPHSDVCNSAASRYCASQGFISGFGPIEYSQSGVSVGCVNSNGATQISETFTDLIQYNSGCSSTAPVSGACSSAIHGYCVANGYAAGGFGPTEHSSDALTLTCVD